MRVATICIEGIGRIIHLYQIQHRWGILIHLVFKAQFLFLSPLQLQMQHRIEQHIAMIRNTRVNIVACVEISSPVVKTVVAVFYLGI